VSNRRLRCAQVFLLVAGILLLLETMLGCVYVLGIGFDSARDIGLDLCLTIAFPIYLLGFRSLRGASVGLWIFFVLQSAYISLNAKSVRLVNPLGWAHGDLLLSAAVLVSAATGMLNDKARVRSTTLSAAFSSKHPGV
jgi:hypothetical protein